MSSLFALSIDKLDISGKRITVLIIFLSKLDEKLVILVKNHAMDFCPNSKNQAFVTASKKIYSVLADHPVY